MRLLLGFVELVFAASISCSFAQMPCEKSESRCVLELPPFTAEMFR
jgi:hypothetical protein